MRSGLSNHLLMADAAALEKRVKFLEKQVSELTDMVKMLMNMNDKFDSLGKKIDTVIQRSKEYAPNG